MDMGVPAMRGRMGWEVGPRGAPGEDVEETFSPALAQRTAVKRDRWQKAIGAVTEGSRKEASGPQAIGTILCRFPRRLDKAGLLSSLRVL